MKKNQVFILISLTALFSCTNVKRDAVKDNVKSDSMTAHVVKESSNNLRIDKNSDDASSEINYSFSNDTLCQTISIIGIDKKKIPKEINFSIMLHDKLHTYEDKTFKGTAELSSSEESFSNNLDKDGGDYFAADYKFETTDYKIKIRLDIEKYDACVISVTASQPSVILGGYSAYLKKFPNDGVMKQGECK